MKTIKAAILGPGYSTVVRTSPASHSSEQPHAMERIRSVRPVEMSGHMLLHAGSIFLALLAQVTSGIFFLLKSDHCVPNGE